MILAGGAWIRVVGIDLPGCARLRRFLPECESVKAAAILGEPVQEGTDGRHDGAARSLRVSTRGGRGAEGPQGGLCCTWEIGAPGETRTHDLQLPRADA